MLQVQIYCCELLSWVRSGDITSPRMTQWLVNRLKWMMLIELWRTTTSRGRCVSLEIISPSTDRFRKHIIRTELQLCVWSLNTNDSSVTILFIFHVITLFIHKLLLFVYTSSLNVGDWLVLHDTGGYTHSMYSRYNSRPAPVVLGHSNNPDDEIKVLRKAETIEEALAMWHWNNWDKGKMWSELVWSIS